MIKRLSFQTKLLLTYSLFVVVLLLGLCLSFYLYNSYLFEKNTDNSLEQLAAKTSQQLDSCVATMERISKEIITDEDFISALTSITLTMEKDTSDIRKIQKALVIKSIYQSDIYRVSVFNESGDFFSSRKYTEYDSSIMQKIANLQWINDARVADGSKYLVLPHKDTWSADNPSDVFSLVRIIKDPGKEIGIIEIQQTAENFKKICDVKGVVKLKVLVLDNKGDLVYSNNNMAKPEIDYYTKLVRMKDTQTSNPAIRSYLQNEIIRFYNSDYTGWTILLIQNRKDLVSQLSLTRNITLLIGAGMILLTLLCFYIFARKLTKPLKKLREAVEKVNIDNLPEEFSEKFELNEIQSLNKSFQRMRQRLNDSIEHEIHYRSLHLSAQFDALQAQINPHFIYNMLGVLANMGEEAEQDDISAVCRNMAKMLRYSTTTSNDRVTLREEVDHAANYLSLLKNRYEHRLEYSIAVDDFIMDIIVPKLLIQPIVENSILHGFEHSSSKMQILIEGFAVENNWQINVVDNGSGFANETLENLKQEIECCSRNISAGQKFPQMSKGRIGIINTFARLFLIFGNELKFELKNNDKVGACISIGGLLPQKAPEEEI